jgi:hypothetical protein
MPLAHAPRPIRRRTHSSVSFHFDHDPIPGRDSQNRERQTLERRTPSH